MYESFYGLKSSPFQLSPDPFFMFASEKCKEAITSISYAISRRKGFVVMTGEVGTGKTLVLRCLFELWEHEQIPYAYFIGPRLSTVDFLSYITFELGIKTKESSKGNMLRALYGFLLAQFDKGLTTVLVIDEAHQMPRSVLEEIRVLANFETAQQKLIQIVLAGQPELEKKLDSVELRSLKQRIAVRCQLEPLREDEVRRYIERRLELAGGDAKAMTIFPAETIHAIYGYSLGIPRLVNNICDQAMIAAYGQQRRVIPVETITEVARRFRLDHGPNLKEGEKPFVPPLPDKSWLVLDDFTAPVVEAIDLDVSAGDAHSGNGTGAQSAARQHDATAEVLAPLDDFNASNNANAPAAPTGELHAAAAAGHAAGSDVARSGKEPGAQAAGAKYEPRSFTASAPAEQAAVGVESPVEGLTESPAMSGALTAAENAVSPDIRPPAEAKAAGAGAARERVAPYAIEPPDLTRTFRYPPTGPTEMPSAAIRGPWSAVEAGPLANAAAQAAAPKKEAARYATAAEVALASQTASQAGSVTNGGRAAGIAAHSARTGRRSLQMPRWLEPGLHLSLILTACAIVPVALATGVFMANRQKQAPAVHSTVNAKRATPAEETANPPQAAPKSTVVDTAVATREIIAPRKESAASKAAESRETAPRTEFLTGALTRPVLRSHTVSGSSSATEPPTITGAPPREMDLGKDLLSTSLPAPIAKPAGQLQPARPISSPSPIYPQVARMESVQGVVVVNAEVNESGQVRDMKVISGPAILRGAALEALRNWKYDPARLDGQPVATRVQVSINFNLK